MRVLGILGILITFGVGFCVQLRYMGIARALKPNRVNNEGYGPFDRELNNLYNWFYGVESPYPEPTRYLGAPKETSGVHANPYGNPESLTQS